MQIRLWNWKYLIWPAKIHIFVSQALKRSSINVRFRFRVIDITVSDTKARTPRRMRIHCAPATFLFSLPRKALSTNSLQRDDVAPRTRVHVHGDEECNVHKDIERLSLRSGHDRCASRIRIFTARRSSRYYIKRFLGLPSAGSEYLRWALWMSRMEFVKVIR